jgi:hypothetical protein
MNISFQIMNWRRRANNSFGQWWVAMGILVVVPTFLEK